MSAERYKDLELIAKGGMGEVFRATMVSDAGVEKPVALKLLRSEVAHGFLEEAKVAMAMSHGNIVQTFDAGHRKGQPFLAMELVEGTDLATLIARGPIPLQHALTIAVEALRGLEYAHRLRGPSGAPLDVVHRDVSPANLLVSRAGEVKVADFGIARSAVERQQERGVRGKLAYMAPEQLAGGAIDARADLYAMGVVLYEMLTGDRPFDGDTPDALRDLVRAGDIDFEPLPEELRPTVQRAMQREAADRFGSATEMREAIEDAAREAELRPSTSALRDWIAAPRETSAPGEFDARLGALLGGDARTGTVEVAPTPVDGPPDEEPQSTRSYAALVILALVVAAAMPFVGFAFDQREPREVRPQPQAESVASAPQERVVPTMVESVETTTETPTKVEPAEMRALAMRARMREVSVEMAEPTMAVDARDAELWIASDPWAHVTIDGTRVGRTTLRGHSLEPGRHVLVLSNPSAGLERRIELELEPGETKRLSVSLDE